MFKWIYSFFKKDKTLEYKISFLLKNLDKIDMDFISYRDIVMSKMDNNIEEHSSKISYIANSDFTKRLDVNILRGKPVLLCLWMINNKGYMVDFNSGLMEKLLLDYLTILDNHSFHEEDYANAIAQINSSKIKAYVVFIDEFVNNLYDTMTEVN